MTRRPPWQEGYSGMMRATSRTSCRRSRSGIAVPGGHSMPCAFAILRRGEPQGRRSSRPGVRQEVSVRAVYRGTGALSRRADIERAEKIRTTYADLVAQGRASGKPKDRDARRRRRNEPSRVVSPSRRNSWRRKRPETARRRGFTSPPRSSRSGSFRISSRSIAAPPAHEVNKPWGPTHPSRLHDQPRVNAYIDSGNPSFAVETSGKCWR